MSRPFVVWIIRALAAGLSRLLSVTPTAASEHAADGLCLATNSVGRVTLVIPDSCPVMIRLGAEAVRERIRPLAGVQIPIEVRAEGLTLSLTLESKLHHSLGDEGFSVVITESGGRLTGAAPQGVYYGAHWLARRILPRKGRDAWLPKLNVSERPTLESRGVYDGEWESLGSLGLDVELNAEWWNEYIGLLSSFGANRFEFWDFLTFLLPSDPRWERLLSRNRAMAEFAHARGVELLAAWTADVPSSVFSEHPDWRAVGEPRGTLVCPSKAGGLNYLLSHRRQLLEAERDILDGIVLYGYDPGGCDCQQCGGKHRDWYRAWMKLVNDHEKLIREVAPRMRVVPILWLFTPEEREQILRHIGEWPDLEEIEAELFSFDPRLMETMRGLAAHKRMVQWDHESDMEGVMWLENPYFRHIRERIQRTHELGYKGALGFILSHPVKLLNSLYLVSQAWNPAATEEEVLREMAMGLFASDDERLVEALKRLEAWTEAIGPTHKRLCSRVNPQPASHHELRQALSAASSARRMFLEAERSVHLRKDYWRYLANLATAEEAIARRIMAQGQAYLAWDGAEAHDKLAARVSALSQAAAFLTSANRENAAIARALQTTPLANMRDDPTFHTREGILNDSLIATELEQVDIERSLFGSAEKEWKRLESAPWADPDAEGRIPVLVAYRGSVKNAVAHCSVDARVTDGVRVVEVGTPRGPHPLASLALRGTVGGLARLTWLMPGSGSLGTVRRVHVYLGSKVKPSPPVARLLKDPAPMDGDFEERSRWWQWHGPIGGKLSWSAEAHSGQWAAQLGVSRSDSYVTLEATADNARTMSLQPGKRYRFRCFVRAAGGEPRFYANVFGGPEADGLHVFGNLQTDRRWHEVALTVRAPDCPDSTLLWPRIVACEREQVLLVDDLRIEAEGPVAEEMVNLKELATGDLEDTSMEHKGQGWQLDASESPVVRARWTSEAHTGRTAAWLQVVKDAPNEWALARTSQENSRRIHVRPKEIRRVSFWCRRVTGAPRFYLDFYGGTPETDGVETYPPLPEDTKWHRLVARVRAPDCSADALLALRFVAHSQAGALLIDDVRTEQEAPVILAVGPCQQRR